MALRFPDPRLFAARRKTGPLTVFVHVPKASGSTVNRHLLLWSRHGLDHAEHYMKSPSTLARLVPRLDWISGHIALNRFRNVLRQHTDRPLRFFGAMRTPARQVASQYNWQIEIFNRSRRFYMTHPPSIRALSQRIRASDNSDPQTVIDNILIRPGLFLDFQSRFLLGRDNELSGPKFERRLSRYTLLAPTDALPDLLRRMTGEAPGEIEMRNSSPYHFDKSVFDTPPLKTFMATENQRDIKFFGEIEARWRKNVADPSN